MEAQRNTFELARRLAKDAPGPVRLLAAEALLAANPADTDGLDVLRGLGRQSNREIALALARVLQTYLHQDMGLPPGGLTAKSKEAGEVARRVLQWATGKGASAAPPLAPTPGIVAPGLPPKSVPAKGPVKLW